MHGWKCRITGVALGCLFLGASVLALPSPAMAAEVTFAGTVEYQGTYSGDSLYVAVLDTTTGEESQVVAVQVFDVGPPPFSRAYSLSFDNEGVGSDLFVAAFLDVDGGGIEDVTAADVLGWYDGQAEPQLVSSASSRADLDFDLPRAEIRGTVTFAPGQTMLRVGVSTGECGSSDLRPRLETAEAGAYAMIGLYPGTYCVMGQGLVPQGSVLLCYGDPACANPTLITLGVSEVRTDIDLDFNLVPVQPSTWGGVKTRFR